MGGARGASPPAPARTHRNRQRAGAGGPDGGRSCRLLRIAVVIRSHLRKARAQSSPAFASRLSEQGGRRHPGNQRQRSPRVVRRARRAKRQNASRGMMPGMPAVRWQRNVVFAAQRANTRLSSSVRAPIRRSPAARRAAVALPRSQDPRATRNCNLRRRRQLPAATTGGIAVWVHFPAAIPRG